MKELEADIWCPRCKVYYGHVYRVMSTDTHWDHLSEPANIAKYCSLCEQPTERK
jgi:hypothetical protein